MSAVSSERPFRPFSAPLEGKEVSSPHSSTHYTLSPGQMSPFEAEFKIAEMAIDELDLEALRDISQEVLSTFSDKIALLAKEYEEMAKVIEEAPNSLKEEEDSEENKVILKDLALTIVNERDLDRLQLLPRTILKELAPIVAARLNTCMKMLALRLPDR